MNPLARKALELRLIAELRRVPISAAITMAEVRRRIAAELGACSPAELAAAVQSLRYQGKMQWDRLALSPSMLAGEEPAQETSGHPDPEAEGGAGPAPSLASTPSSIAPGPDDEDDEDYPGGVNDEATEEPQAEQGPARREPLSPESAPGNGADDLRHEQPALPERSVEEPRPARADDQPAGAGERRQAAPARAAAGEALRPPGGWSKASNIGGARPIPAPAHEPEVERQVRESVNELSARRRLARSTGTVRQPLEIRKFGIADANIAEAVSSLLCEEPRDLMLAVSRKHPKMWRRVIMLARATDQRPAQALYAALEAGLDALEPQQEEAA